MNQELHNDLVSAARYLTRVTWEQGDDPANDKGFDQIAFGLARLKAATQAIDIELLNDQIELLQERAERAEKAAERLGYDKEQLQSLYNQAREELRLARAAQRDAQNGYVSLPRVPQLWQCNICNERKAQIGSFICDDCYNNKELHANGYASERLAATNGYTSERGVRTATAWQCARCKQYTAPSESMPSLCESCEDLVTSEPPY